MRMLNRLPVTSSRRCVQITALGADDVPDVKMSAHIVSTSGSRPGSPVVCAASSPFQSAPATTGSSPSIHRRVMTTGFVVGVRSASEHALSKTLAQLRPWSLIVVIANDDDYIEDMMTAFRA